MDVYILPRVGAGEVRGAGEAGEGSVAAGRLRIIYQDRSLPVLKFGGKTIRHGALWLNSAGFWYCSERCSLQP